MKKICRSCESGQAFIELTVMLIGITAMILGVIIIFGIENSSNTVLLDARFEAHKAARQSEMPLREEEIDTWQESTLELAENRISPNPSVSSSTNTAKLFSERGRTYILTANKKMLTKNLIIPFSLTASMQKNSSNNSVLPMTQGMDSALYSKNDGLNVTHNYERYGYWRSMEVYNANFRHDFFHDISGNNAFYAARLVKGSASTGGAAATINASHQHGPLNSSSDAAEIMYNSFNKLFGIRIKNSTIKDNPGNQVYMPITGTTSP